MEVQQKTEVPRKSKLGLIRECEEEAQAANLGIFLNEGIRSKIINQI